MVNVSALKAIFMGKSGTVLCLNLELPRHYLHGKLRVKQIYLIVLATETFLVGFPNLP